MKIRSGFVSNSSSSSFIIIEPFEKSEKKNREIIKNFLTEKYERNGYLIFPDNSGEMEFGWQDEIYNDTISKLNFSYIQAFMVENKHPEYMKMFEDYIRDVLDIKSDIEISVESFYIDHQSASIEGKNTEMFKDMKTFTSFIESDFSYIKSCNDNC